MERSTRDLAADLLSGIVAARRAGCTTIYLGDLADPMNREPLQLAHAAFAAVPIDEHRVLTRREWANVYARAEAAVRSGWSPQASSGFAAAT